MRQGVYNVYLNDFTCKQCGKRLVGLAKPVWKPYYRDQDRCVTCRLLDDAPVSAIRYRLERQGDTGHAVVLENGTEAPLPNVAPNRSEFNWGYGGLGPCVLAASLLCHALGIEPDEPLVNQFMWRVVANLPDEGGDISADEILFFYEWFIATNGEDQQQ